MVDTTIPDAWITLVSHEEALARRPRGGARRGRLELPTIANMGRLLMTHPRIGPAFNGLMREVMAGSETLSPAECQMIAAVSTAAQDCHY
jgi:hypothetical protein